MNVDLLVLFQPSVHLVKCYFGEVFEVTTAVNSDCPLGGAFPHYEVICGGGRALLWVP